MLSPDSIPENLCVLNQNIIPLELQLLSNLFIFSVYF